MRQIIRILLEKASGVLRSISKRVYVYPMEVIAKEWSEIDGNPTLWLKHDLDEKSVIFDIGGYKGYFSAMIFSMYQCGEIYIFEPVKKYADRLKVEFAHNKHFHIYNFGLAEKSSKARMALLNDGSSIFRNGKMTEDVILKRASEFINEYAIDHIDMMKINIEGGEYGLLEHLIETKLVRKIDNIQVQFHDFVPNAESRMLRIHERLRETHYLTYQYKFFWENWRIIDKI
ncbi:FkbM family methyltransferase [bacterium]|nr:FkbM family methyltransferase [bacterium]